MVIGLALAAVLLQTRSGYFSDSLDSVSYVTGSAFRAAGLSKATTDDDYALLEVTNSEQTPSTSASIIASFTITWTPLMSGQTPPAAALVEVGKGYTFLVFGAGTCSLVDAAGTTIDSVDGTDTSLNNAGMAMLTTTSYTVPLTVQPDGTATGTLLVPSDVVSTTYDSTGAIATEASENISVVSMEATTLSTQKQDLKGRYIAAKWPLPRLQGATSSQSVRSQ